MLAVIILVVAIIAPVISLKLCLEEPPQSNDHASLRLLRLALKRFSFQDVCVSFQIKKISILCLFRVEIILFPLLSLFCFFFLVSSPALYLI